MRPKTRILIAAASLLIGASAMVRAAAGDPPPSSLDLGAAKPKAKPDTGSVAVTGGIAPIGQTPLSKQKAAAEAGTPGAAGNAGVGTTVKSPLGTKGVLGAPVAGGKPAQDDAASSGDVVVKMPSNVKK